MRILNLGCGTKVSSNTDVVNIDWSVYLWAQKNPISRFVVKQLVRGERLRRFNELPKNILVHDLAKGIPFPLQSVDVIYHSHFLEHLDRDVAETFLLQAKEVLKPGGIHRIVVPDFEKLCTQYISHIPAAELDEVAAGLHEDYISNIIEQSIRREAYGTSQQPALRRFIENLLLGDARKRGETHQWMYDRISLPVILKSLGYLNVSIEQYNTSRIPGWNEYGLEVDERGNEYKTSSLYVEAAT